MARTLTPFGILALLGLLLIPAGTAQAQAGVDCSTPRRVVSGFLHWQQPEHLDEVKAAACFDGEDRQAAITAARRLKQVLDARGLWVKVEAIPDKPDHRDSLGMAQYALFSDQLPEVYVVRSDKRWLFPLAVQQQVPRLYDATFSSWLPRLVNRLPTGLRKKVLGQEAWKFLALVLIVFLALVVRRLVTYMVEGYVQRAVEKVAGPWGGRVALLIAQPAGTLAMAGALAVYLPDLQLGVTVTLVALLAVRVIAAISVIWAAYRGIDLLSDVMQERADKSDTKLDDQLVPLVRKTLKIFTIAVGTIFVLQNLNIDVASLVAGLGLGGLAFALAAKDTLANLFGSVMIFADRPFQIGDWVIAGGVEGTVEEVGFRSTRIRTFYNSLVSVPNSKIADTAVDNMGLREFRRISVTLGLTYDTSPEQMQAFVEGVRALIAAHPDTRKDYYEVHFKDFGAHSLDVMLYFFVKVDAWSDELRARHTIFLDIMRLARTLNVDFAFPTQTLHIDGMRPEPSVRKAPPTADLEAAVLAIGPGGVGARSGGPELTHGFFATPAEPEENA